MQTRVQCFLQCIPPTYSLKRQKKLLFKYFFLEMNMRRNTAFKKKLCNVCNNSCVIYYCLHHECLCTRSLTTQRDTILIHRKTNHEHISEM